MVEQKVGYAEVVVGKHTYGTPTMFGDPEHLHVGAFNSIGPHVSLVVESHRIDTVTSFPVMTQFCPDVEDANRVQLGHIRIGNDVYIGWGATIFGGVTIGDGAVIGAGAVVVKDVPPYAVVVGNPSKIVRYRFTNAQIAELLKIQWWFWDDDKIREAAGLLSSPDIDAFIERYRVIP